MVTLGSWRRHADLPPRSPDVPRERQHLPNMHEVLVALRRYRLAQKSLLVAS